jgi:hypothetical protein
MKGYRLKGINESNPFLNLFINGVFHAIFNRDSWTDKTCQLSVPLIQTLNNPHNPIIIPHLSPSLSKPNPHYAVMHAYGCVLDGPDRDTQLSE